MNHDATLLAGIVLGILLTGSIIGAVLQRTITSESGLRVVENLVARVNAWWLMSAFIGVPLFSGKMGTLILFGLASFFALREFITLTPTRRGDHRVFFWAFFIITPLQYWTLAAHWYGRFTILIPVYAFLFYLTFAMQRPSMRTLGRLSHAIRVGLATGFDSGESLDCVYENEARGEMGIGKVIDRGWHSSAPIIPCAPFSSIASPASSAPPPSPQHGS